MIISFFFILLSFGTLCLSAEAPTPHNLPFDQEKVVYEFLDLLNGKPTDDCVNVPSYRVNDTGFFDFKGSSKVSTADYDRFSKLSESVLSFKKGGARTGPNANLSGRPYGSAFSIGGNLILTSFHVLDDKYQNASKCSDFNLTHRQSSQKLSCQTVHLCDRVLDFCLIEMKPTKKPIPGVKISPLQINDPKEAVTFGATVIGNSVGEGLKVSRGTGLELRNQYLVVNAPVTGGNSGGPLFDDHNRVIGIVRSLEKVQTNVGALKPNGKPADPVFGFKTKAINMSHIIKYVRTMLVGKPEVLAKFNEAVSK